MSKSKLSSLDYQDPAYWQDEPTTGSAQTKRGEMVVPERRQEYQHVNPIEKVDVNASGNIQQSADYTADPISRGWAMLIKTSAVTVFLAALTLMAMFIFGSWGALGAVMFLWWLLVASLEWIVVFVILAILDYRETPAAQNRYAMRRVINMMAVEQAMRLIGIYGEESYAKATRAIRRARI